MDPQALLSDRKKRPDRGYEENTEQRIEALEVEPQYTMRELFDELTTFAADIRVQSDEQASSGVRNDHLGMGQVRYDFTTKAGRLLSIQNLDMLNEAVSFENEVVQCYSKLFADEGTTELEVEVQDEDLSDEERKTEELELGTNIIDKEVKAYEAPKWLPALQRSGIRALAHETTAQYIGRHNLAIQEGEPSKQTAELIREFTAVSQFPNDAEVQLIADMDPVQTGTGQEADGAAFARIKAHFENREYSLRALKVLRAYKKPLDNIEDVKAYLILMKKKRALLRKRAKQAGS